MGELYAIRAAERAAIDWATYRLLLITLSFSSPLGARSGGVFVGQESRPRHRHPQWRASRAHATFRPIKRSISFGTPGQGTKIPVHITHIVILHIAHMFRGMGLARTSAGQPDRCCPGPPVVRLAPFQLSLGMIAARITLLGMMPDGSCGSTVRTISPWPRASRQLQMNPRSPCLLVPGTVCSRRS